MTTNKAFQEENIMSKHLSTPFRFDYVGSFLRPAKLKEARQQFAEEKISADELKAVEDDGIRELVAKQKKAGYHVITDGEFRRSYWHLDFMWGLALSISSSTMAITSTAKRRHMAPAQ